MRSDLAILARVGSHAYGTARPDSDDDYRGVYLAPTVDLYRLRPRGRNSRPVVLETGEVQVRVPDPVGLFERARRGIDAVAAEFADLDERLAVAVASSPLPEHPDVAAIDDLLIALRSGMF